MEFLKFFRLGIVVMGLYALTSCSASEDKGPEEFFVPKAKRQSKDSIPFVNPTPVPDPFVRACPLAPRFDFPVGRPRKGDMDTAGYFKARGFLGKEHLGEDWNRNTGGNTDIGNFVYAVADGVVFDSQDYGEGWGPVVRLLHNVGSLEKPVYVESVYAHLNSVFVNPGNRMKKGDVLGTIGTAKGKYHAHLHFEIRENPGRRIGAGIDGDTLGFLDPTDFITPRRKLNQPN